MNVIFTAADALYKETFNSQLNKGSNQPAQRAVFVY